MDWPCAYLGEHLVWSELGLRFASRARHNTRRKQQSAHQQRSTIPENHQHASLGGLQLQDRDKATAASARSVSPMAGSCGFYGNAHMTGPQHTASQRSLLCALVSLQPWMGAKVTDQAANGENHKRFRGGSLRHHL